MSRLLGLFAGGSDASAVGLPVSFVMAQLEAGRVYQRGVDVGGEAGKGYGAIAVSVTLSDAVASMQYRVRLAVGGAVVKDWTPASGALGAGEQTVICPAVPAWRGGLFIDLRANNHDDTIQLGTSAVRMGRIIFVEGQSLAVRAFKNFDGTTSGIADAGIAVGFDGWVYARYYDSVSYGSPTWQRPADGGDYDSTFVAQFLALQIEAFDVACAVAGYSSGGRAIAHFTTEPAGVGTARAVFRDVEGFEAFIWLQGHADARDGTSYATYQAELDALHAEISGQNVVRGSNFAMMVATIPNIMTNTWGERAAINTIRRAARDWVEARSDSVYVQPADIDLYDGVHQSQAGSLALARHFHRATYAQLGRSDDHRGPILGTPSRSGVDITVPLTHRVGADGLVQQGDFSRRIAVYDPASPATPLALDATTPLSVNADSIVVHLAADAGAQALELWLHPSPSAFDAPADMLYDNAADHASFTVGRHVDTSLEALTIAAPAVSAPSDMYVHMPLGGDFIDQAGTLSGRSSAAGFVTDAQRGQVLSLNGSQFVDLGGAFALGAGGYTKALWGKLESLSGNKNLLSSSVGVDANNTIFWISGSTLGAITNNGFPTRATATLQAADVEGIWVHYAVTYDATTGDLHTYMNGTQVGSENVGAGANITGAEQIGNFTYSGSNGWVGQLSDVRIFQRPLSATEIAAIHATT